MTPPPNTHALALLASVTASSACAMFTGWTVPLQIAELTNQLDWSAAHAGSVFSATFLCVGLAIVSATPFIARVPIKLFSLLGALCATLGFALIALFPSTLSLCIAGLLTSGAGQGLAAVGMSALAAATHAPGRIFGLAATLGIFHSAAWFLLLPRFPFAPPGGDALFLGCTLAMGLCLAIIAFAPIPRVRPAAPVKASISFTFDAGATMLLVGNFVFIAAAASVWTYTEPLGARLGLSTESTGVMLAAATVASMAGTLGIVWLDRAGGLGLYLAIAASVTAATLFITCITSSIVVYCIALIGQSFGQVYFASLVFLLCIRREHTGRLAALSRSSTIFGAAAGPILGAYLINVGQMALAIGAAALCAFGWAFAAFGGHKASMAAR